MSLVAIGIVEHCLQECESPLPKILTSYMMCLVIVSQNDKVLGSDWNCKIIIVKNRCK